MISTQNLSSELHEAALTARMPNERLLWEGKPNAARAVRMSYAIYIFAVPWTAFSIFWTASAIGMGSQQPSLARFGFAAFGLPFIAIGLSMFYAPFGMAKKARQMAYAITDKRIMTLTLDRKGGIKVEYYVPTPGTQFECVVLPDGSGDIVYNKKRITDSEGSTRTESSTLVGIPNVREVERLLWTTFIG